MLKLFNNEMRNRPFSGQNNFLNSKVVFIVNALILQGNLQIHQVHVGQDGQVGTELSFKQHFTLVFKINVAVGMISHY